MTEDEASAREHLGGPAVGDPDGFGRYGVMERQELGALCHECGEWPANVGAHAFMAHGGMTAAEYRQSHGLKRGQPLTSLAVSRKQSQAGRERLGSPQWQRFEAARDPDAAQRARDLEAMSTPQGAAERGVRTAARNRQAQWAERECVWCGRLFRADRRTCSDECLASLRRASRMDARSDLSAEDVAAVRRDPATVVPALQARGVPSAAIGRALGRSPAWMSRHYPRRAVG